MWWGTAVEAPDPGALARFYSDLVGWPIIHEEAERSCSLLLRDRSTSCFSKQRDTGHLGGRRLQGISAR